YDTAISVYSGSRGNLTQVAGNDDDTGNGCHTQDGPDYGASLIFFDVAAGETLHIMVGSGYYSPSGGDLLFSLTQAPPPPANDDIEQATPVTALPFSDQIETRTATEAVDDPFSYNGGPGPSIWYDVVARADMRV